LAGDEEEGEEATFSCCCLRPAEVERVREGVAEDFLAPFFAEEDEARGAILFFTKF